MNFNNLHMKSRIYLFFLAIGWLPLAACGLLPVKYSAEPIDAQVVDAETGTPLEGVVVVAHWVLEGGIHVDRVGELKILEAVTDKDGRFHFAGWGPIWHKGASRLTYMDPELILFKSGYEYQRLDNERTPEALGGKPYTIRRSDWNGQTIKLKRFKGTLEKYSEQLGYITTPLGFAYNGRNCDWLYTPHMIVALHLERKRFLSNKIHSSLPSIEDFNGLIIKCDAKKDFFKGYLP